MNAWMRMSPRNLSPVLLQLGIILLLAVPSTLIAQSAPLPVKPGLWEMSTSVSRANAPQPALPPDAEAKIAALPPAQQAQVRAMMAGGAGPGGAAKPMATTRQTCITGQMSMDSLLNQAQQSPGMQCTYSNRVQTATGASFDTSCTGQTGSAQGHTQFHATDAEHMTSTTHMTVTSSARGSSSSSTMDITTTGRFVSADCGDVKPMGAPPAAK
jgi:hypothetical protein